MVGKNAKILGFGALAPFHFWPKFKLGFFVPRLRRGRVNPAPAPRGTNAASEVLGFIGTVRCQWFYLIVERWLHTKKNQHIIYKIYPTVGGVRALEN